MAADFFIVAYQVLERNGQTPAPRDQLLGVEPMPARLRAAAELELRLCARYARDRETRIAYVDRANRVAAAHPMVNGG